MTLEIPVSQGKSDKEGLVEFNISSLVISFDVKLFIKYLSGILFPIFLCLFQETEIIGCIFVASGQFPPGRLQALFFLCLFHLFYGYRCDERPLPQIIEHPVRLAGKACIRANDETGQSKVMQNLLFKRNEGGLFVPIPAINADGQWNS